jgi:hypothetical protein
MDDDDFLGKFKPVLSGLVDKEIKEERRKICLECDEYMVKFKMIASGKFTGMCGKCGCWLKPKTAIKDFKCPLEKW